MIQEKLIKFATRVPVFMYLTDYREYSLRDVITQLEPELFKKVTGLDVKDFELLVSLNVFNEALMNDAVYKFKRYEDASLIYTGIDKHTGENIGLYSTVVSREDYDVMAGQLTASMKSDTSTEGDIIDDSRFNDAKEHSHNKNGISLSMAAESWSTYTTQNKPNMQSATYQTSDVSLTSLTPAKIRTVAQVNTNTVNAGSLVIHKAFGIGKVKGIDGSIIIVSFKGVDKKFQFPGAFEQGFLKLDE